MALILVMGALVANSAMRPSRGNASGGILGGPELAAGTETAGQPTFLGIPQVISSAEAAAPQGVADSLSTPSLRDDATSIAPGTPALLASAPILDGMDQQDPASEAPINIVSIAHYFIQPAAGLNWGILHGHNAVDIANVCGTPIVAAAGGIVIDGDGSGNWNGGYGNFLLLQHPNGTKTRYAHLKTLAVSIGDEVQQGQQIATMGTTGNSTGCHVHFEVQGVKNPFARK